MIIIASLAALSLVPIRIRLRACTAPLGGELRFGLSLTGRPKRLPYALRAVLLGGKIRFFLLTKRGVTLLKKRRKRKKRRSFRLAAALLRAVDIPELEVSGSVGPRNDAAASALAAGLLGGIVDQAERIAFSRLPCGLPERRRIRIMPAFSGDKPFFCADGIVLTDLRKLIMSLAKAYLLKEN